MSLGENWKRIIEGLSPPPLPLPSYPPTPYLYVINVNAFLPLILLTLLIGTTNATQRNATNECSGAGGALVCGEPRHGAPQALLPPHRHAGAPDDTTQHTLVTYPHTLVTYPSPHTQSYNPPFTPS